MENFTQEQISGTKNKRQKIDLDSMRSKFCSSLEGKSTYTDLTGKSIVLDASDKSIASNVTNSGNTTELNALTIHSPATNATSDVVVANENGVNMDYLIDENV